jgi:hypothetical protein
MADIKIVLDKLNEMDKRLDNIDITLVKQSKDLEYHILRTDILQEKVAPIEKHVLLINATVKIIIALAGAISFLIGIYAAISKI